MVDSNSVVEKKQDLCCVTGEYEKIMLKQKEELEQLVEFMKNKIKKNKRPFLNYFKNGL